MPIGPGVDGLVDVVVDADVGIGLGGDTRLLTEVVDAQAPEVSLVEVRERGGVARLVARDQLRSLARSTVG